MARPRADGTPPRPPNKRKLSDAALHALKPEGKPYAVWDTKQRGLVVVVHPSGTKSWKVFYTFGQRPRWYHIDRADRIGLADARRIAAKIALEVLSGKDPAAERRAGRSQGTCGELAARYVTEHAMKANRSWRQAEALVKRNLLPRWGKLQASSIRRDDVKSAFAAIKSPITANQTLAAASAIFSWAIEEKVGGIEANPCLGVKRNPVTSRDRVLSDSEVKTFWEAFDDAGLVAAAALKLILLTGQRPGEVAAMRSEHIVDGWWNLPGKPDPKLGWPGTKNGRTHRVWLSEPARQIIEELGTTGRLLKGGSRLDGAMRDISAKLGVGEKATPHDLRRTCLTKITGLGFGRDAMDRIANHKSDTVTDVYDRHTYADDDRRIMEAVGREFMALVEGGPAGNVVEFRR